MDPNMARLLAQVVDTVDPWATPAEWATAALAFAALVGSAVAIVISRRSEKRQLFIPLHEVLTGTESQEGRRLFHQRIQVPEDVGTLLAESPGEYDLINRTLGLYNTLGIYVHRGYIDMGMARDNWAAALRGSWPRIESFLRWRRDNHGDPHRWEPLIWLAQECGADVPPEFRVQPGWSRREVDRRQIRAVPRR